MDVAEENADNFNPIFGTAAVQLVALRVAVSFVPDTLACSVVQCSTNASSLKRS